MDFILDNLASFNTMGKKQIYLDTEVKICFDIINAYELSHWIFPDLLNDLKFLSGTINKKHPKILIFMMYVTWYLINNYLHIGNLYSVTWQINFSTK